MLKESPVFSSFSVSNLDEARKFYSDTLGLIVKDNEMGVMELHFPKSVVVIYPKPDHAAANFTVLHFPVKDVETAVEELTSAGYKIRKI